MNNEIPNLGSVITSPKVRRAIYAVYVIAVFTSGAVSAGFAITAGGNPEWLNIANAVMLYAGVPIGGLAIANAPSKEQVEVLESVAVVEYVPQRTGYEG